MQAGLHAVSWPPSDPARCMCAIQPTARTSLSPFLPACLQHAVEQLEVEFSAVLAGLASDASLAKFRTEYEKVFGALKQAHEGEKRLAGKVKDLSDEIAANGACPRPRALQLQQQHSGSSGRAWQARCGCAWTHACPAL